MNETNLDWRDLALFAAIARGGGLAPAARETGVSSPTLGRRMLALEAAVGRTLFHRRARGYELTRDGEALMERVGAIERQVADLRAELAPGDRRVPIGLSAGTWMTHFLARHIDDLLRPDEPALLTFLSADHRLDIGRRQALIGIRNARPDEEHLAARKLGPVAFAAYARPGAPAGWIGVAADTPSARWVRETHGADLVMAVNSPRHALDLALAGVGRLVLPCFVGDGQAGLARVGPPIDALAHDQWLVLHQHARHDPPVRRLIARLVALIGANRDLFAGRR